MIPFKDITLADKDTITSFTMKSDRRNCDLSFSNLCSWRFLYDTQFAVVDNFLVFKFWAGEQLAYMMPVGTGDLKAVLWELIEDARKENQHFCMLGVCSNMRTDLEAILPEQFTFTEDRDYADYIYLRSDLSTLKGKKFQAKRNHINRFRNTYPDYEYTPITPDRIQECLDLEAEWCKVNNCDQQEGGLEEEQLYFIKLGLLTPNALNKLYEIVKDKNPVVAACLLDEVNVERKQPQAETEDKVSLDELESLLTKLESKMPKK